MKTADEAEELKIKARIIQRKLNNSRETRRKYMKEIETMERQITANIQLCTNLRKQEQEMQDQYNEIGKHFRTLTKQ